MTDLTPAAQALLDDLRYAARHEKSGAIAAALLKLDFDIEARLAAIQAEARASADAEMRSAIRAALNELGVPGDGYPAPVANAVDILLAALAATPAEP